MMRTSESVNTSYPQLGKSFQTRAITLRRIWHALLPHAANNSIFNRRFSRIEETRETDNGSPMAHGR